MRNDLGLVAAPLVILAKRKLRKAAGGHGGSAAGVDAADISRVRSDQWFLQGKGCDYEAKASINVPSSDPVEEKFPSGTPNNPCFAVAIPQLRTYLHMTRSFPKNDL